LKVMSGLLFAKAGEISIMDHNPARRRPEFLREIFFVPEEFVLPKLSIATYQKRIALFYPNFSEADFHAYLDTFQLTPSLQLNQLSLGQKKKVMLAFAMASNCRLLIFDEPTNSLDIPSKSQFRKLLAGSIKEDQIYLISTHQVRDLGNLMDPIIILDQGKILFHQSQEAIAQRLSFELYQQAKEPEGVLHAERVPGGYMVMNENQYGEETVVDIELLFNAIVTEPERIKALFTSKVAHS
ncbi:MAG: ATP-binding cassette domain-containing protein, partial [Bacteroidota bacterium]